MAKKKKVEKNLTPDQQLEADYQKAVRRMEGAEKMLQPQDRVHMYKEAMLMFEALGGYKDSEENVKRCKKRLPILREEYREEIYQTGLRLKDEAKDSAGYRAAITEFRKLKQDYKDAPAQLAECKQLKNKALKNEKYRSIGKKALVLAVFAAAAAFVVFLRSPEAFYQEGKILMGIGDYERASTVFAKSAGYKDTKELVMDCNYERALQSAQDGGYEKAVKILYNGKYTDADSLARKAAYELKVLDTAIPGDIVIYGTTKWIVADSAGQKRLLVRQRPARARVVYQTVGKSSCWEASVMRQWLNGKFFQNSFSAYEQEAIAQTEIVTEANSMYGTAGGDAAKDHVFLLDDKEAEQYQSVLKVSGNQKAWWLRTPGKNADSMAFVAADGTVMHYGYAADSKDIAVRPAVWVNVE